MPDQASIPRSNQASLYDEAVETFGAALDRVARSYEIDATKRQDLVQEIHLGIWRSLARFDGRCSLRTWVYRVAHNVGASHVMSERRYRTRALVGLEGVENQPFGSDQDADLDRQTLLARLHGLIAMLRPLDRQIVTLYLEGMDAATMSEITGISSGNVATKLTRIKKLLGSWAKAGNR